jgi:hypothetical protein
MDRKQLKTFIKESVDQCVETIIASEAVTKGNLLEFMRKDAKILFDNEDGTSQELPFGHPMHVGEMKKIHSGLCKIRDCYRSGSGKRLVFASACRVLADLIEKFAKESD